MPYYIGGHIKDAISGVGLFNAFVQNPTNGFFIGVDSNGNWVDYSGVPTGTTLTAGAPGHIAQNFVVGNINTADGAGNWTVISLQRSPETPNTGGGTH